MISATENPPLGFLVWHALSSVQLWDALLNLREEAQAFDCVLYRGIVRWRVAIPRRTRLRG